MPFILSISFRLLLALLALIALPACSDVERSPESVAITCPPGMMQAAKQGICLRDSCGNGSLDADEVCDDGNVIAGDGCSPDCRSTETCGNGTVDHAVGEVCDDGNTAPGDRCCSDCRSCPELAASAPAEAPVATVPAPCLPAPPAPSVTQAVAVQKPPGASQADQARPGAHTVMQARRPAPPSGPAMRRLAEQARTSMEELALARSTIAQLEQNNAELLQSLEDQLRLLDDMRQRLVRGTDLQ